MQYTKQFTHNGITFQIIVDLLTRKTIIENKIVSFNNVQISDIPYGRFNFYSEVSDFDTKKTILDYEEKAKDYADRQQSGDINVGNLLMELGFSATGNMPAPKSTNISGFSQQEQMATPAQINFVNDFGHEKMVNDVKYMQNPFAKNTPTYDSNPINQDSNNNPENTTTNTPNQ